MGVIITLRNSQDKSYFKDFMMDIYEQYNAMNKCNPITEALICSGYFQEGNSGKSYKATIDKHSEKEHTLISTLSSVKKITLVGIREIKEKEEKKEEKGTSEWRDSYKRFIEHLRHKLGAKKVKAYISMAGNWHAKMLIFRTEDRCVAGIIGSSNFTKPAYGSVGYTHFNIEADTFIFVDTLDKKILELVNRVRDSKGDSSDVMVVKYAPEDNGNKSEADLLEKHYRNIIEMISDQSRYKEI